MRCEQKFHDAMSDPWQTHSDGGRIEGHVGWSAAATAARRIIKPRCVQGKKSARRCLCDATRGLCSRPSMRRNRVDARRQSSTRP
jgi:hypothetical protein